MQVSKALDRTTIPAIVKEDDETINQLVEVSENLISNRLNAIQESNHILLREKLLIKLGKKQKLERINIPQKINLQIKNLQHNLE